MDHTVSLIIIGTSHHNTLSMIRCIGHNDLRPYVIIYGKTNSYVTFSHYLAGYSQVDTANEAVNTLSMICDVLPPKPVVITCSDEVAMLLNNSYEEYSEKCFFFNAGIDGRVTQFMDKGLQCELAKVAGFAVPWSFVCSPEKLPDGQIQFPCIIKPKESIHGGKKFFLCNSPEDLKLSLQEFDPEYPILTQQYINGDYEIVIVGLTIAGVTYIPGYVHKHRDYKGGTTYSTVFSVSKLPQEVVKASKNMLAEIGYEGLWGIECIFSNDEYYFIELNLRNDATTYSMAVAGVNLPLAFYKAKRGYDMLPIVSRDVEEINSMVEFEDFNFVLKRKTSLFQWIKELQRSKCLYYYDKNDMGPFRKKSREYISILFKRIMHGR